LRIIILFKKRGLAKSFVSSISFDKYSQINIFKYVYLTKTEREDTHTSTIVRDNDPRRLWLHYFIIRSSWSPETSTPRRTSCLVKSEWLRLGLSLQWVTGKYVRSRMNIMDIYKHHVIILLQRVNWKYFWIVQSYDCVNNNGMCSLHCQVFVSVLCDTPVCKSQKEVLYSRCTCFESRLEPLTTLAGFSWSFILHRAERGFVYIIPLDRPQRIILRPFNLSECFYRL